MSSNSQEKNNSSPPKKNIMTPTVNQCVKLKSKLKLKVKMFNSFEICHLFLFVLRFYGPVNPMGSCRARSVYLTARLLGRLSPLSG